MGRKVDEASMGNSSSGHGQDDPRRTVSAYVDRNAEIAMRKELADGPNVVVNQEDLDRLGAQVQRELRGRLRDFRLKGKGAGVVLTGRVGTYYVKQLAQHAVMRATYLPIIGNEIEVS